MTPMQNVESKLFTIFQVVNDWVKFAEAKNAGLLVISGAGSAAILTFVASSQAVSVGWKRLLFSSVLLLLLGGVFSLASFIPRTNLKYILNLMENWGEPEDADNFYFFGHLAKYEPNTLATALTRSYFPQTSQPVTQSKEQLDLAAQIIVNSRIAIFKFRLFTVAVWFVILAALVIIIGLIVQAYNDLGRLIL